MKNLNLYIACVICLVFVFGCAQVEQKKYSTSCIPKQVMRGERDKAFDSNIFGVSTSATIYPFANSSNTSGCGDDEKITFLFKREIFVTLNFENIKEEMASGRGEYLMTMSNLMGCSEDAFPAFSFMAVNRYHHIFKNNNQEAVEFISLLREEISSNHELDSKCLL